MVLEPFWVSLLTYSELRCGDNPSAISARLTLAAQFDVAVFASGNNHENGENTNFDPYVSSRYTIGVAAVDKSGRHASYSNPGASVLVSAPGGDEEDITKNIVANIFGGCVSGYLYCATEVFVSNGTGLTSQCPLCRPTL